MNLYDCHINHGVLHIRIVTEHNEYAFENICLKPSSKTPEGAVPVAKRLRQIAPRRIRPHTIMSTDSSEIGAADQTFWNGVRLVTVEADGYGVTAHDPLLRPQPRGEGCITGEL